MDSARAVARRGGPNQIFTVGHSTRSREELLAILRDPFEVVRLIDVRAFPSSRRHPQFSAEELARWLPENGIEYLHRRELGGRRSPVEGSQNGAWREPQFRGYADHMATGEFEAAIAELEDLAREHPTALMCAEAVWWRCHRRLIADGLTVRGWEVLHLGVGGPPRAHELPEFAVVERQRITYPPQQASLLD